VKPSSGWIKPILLCAPFSIKSLKKKGENHQTWGLWHNYIIFYWKFNSKEPFPHGGHRSLETVKLELPMWLNIQNPGSRLVGSSLNRGRIWVWSIQIQLRGERIRRGTPTFLRAIIGRWLSFRGSLGSPLAGCFPDSQAGLGTIFAGLPEPWVSLHPSSGYTMLLLSVLVTGSTPNVSTGSSFYPAQHRTQHTERLALCLWASALEPDWLCLNLSSITGRLAWSQGQSLSFSGS
jgi:hypothetical protein